MQSIRVDGNDVLAVCKAMQEARKLAVEQNEPVLVEAMSYRLAAHSSSDDPSGYRNKAEEDKWRAKDPILRMKNWLLAQNWWDDAREKQLLEGLRQQVLAAMKLAQQRPPARLEDLITDVYDEPPALLRQQLANLKAPIRKYPEAYPKSAGGTDHG
jgi:2-oxoisovalerate dehydrogenase E1 component alpha subunit